MHANSKSGVNDNKGRNKIIGIIENSITLLVLSSISNL
jgi:hypothetical protein